MEHQLEIQQVTSLIDLNHNQVATSIIQEVTEGNVNPIEVHMALKRMQKISETVIEDKNYKESLEKAVNNHLEGNSKSVKFKGHSIGIQPVYTIYDYKVTKDPVWEAWNEIKLRAEEELKSREELLKAGWSPNTFGIQSRTIVVEEIPTVEMTEVMSDYTIFPPVKHQKMGARVTFKRE